MLNGREAVWRSVEEYTPPENRGIYSLISYKGRKLYLPTENTGNITLIEVS